MQRKHKRRLSLQRYNHGKQEADNKRKKVKNERNSNQDHSLHCGRSNNLRDGHGNHVEIEPSEPSDGDAESGSRLHPEGWKPGSPGSSRPQGKARSGNAQGLHPSAQDKPKDSIQIRRGDGPNQCRRPANGPDIPDPDDFISRLSEVEGRFGESYSIIY